MCLDTDTDMNETLNTVTGYNFNADTDLEYEKKNIMSLEIVIMRAFICLLLPLYLINLIFP